MPEKIGCKYMTAPARYYSETQIIDSRIGEPFASDEDVQGRCGSRVDTHGQSVISNYECCYAKLRLVLGSDPKYLMGLA